MQAHLLLRLEAPLMSFGRTAVDHRRPVQAWPATSMLTGLLGNALGWTQAHAAALDALQSRLRWAARIDRPGEALQDFQTAQLAKNDRGWTSRGVVEGRDGGAATYESPHLRYRDYRADASVLVALRLEQVNEEPTLEQLAQALDAPRRPLFLGRKGCPPATRIGIGIVQSVDAVAAAREAPALPGGVAPADAALYFCEGAAPVEKDQLLREHLCSDQRRFALDVHAGQQRVYERPARAGAWPRVASRGLP